MSNMAMPNPVETDVRGVLTRAAEQAEAEAHGEPRLRLGRLAVDDREELLAATATRLQSRRPARRTAKPVTLEKEIQDWWARLLGYADARRQQRLNSLRNEVFVVLAESDVIRREEAGWTVVAPSRAAAGPMVTRENLGAWVLKANPSTWDVSGWIHDRGGSLDTWPVARNYRSQLMTPGDDVLLWVSGNDPTCPAGIRARGTVTGPCHDAQGEGPHWVDRAAMKRADYFAAVDVTLLDSLIPRHTLVQHRTLREVEVLRSPFSSNPSYLTVEQLADLEAFQSR